jgi:hypothetical protein
MDQYQNLIAAAKTAKRILLEAGFSEAHADEIHSRMVFLAGSYLPPVTGEITINLSDTRVN